MDNIRLYEVDTAYVNYLVPCAPLLFHNKKQGQQNERKYIGVLLQVNGYDYFAPLSSFKDKHRHMVDSLDFLKIKDYAVINLNCMFPVPKECYSYVDISQERNPKYKSLLLAEYRIIKGIQEKIRKNAKTLYELKVSGKTSPLTKRCNDYVELEVLCQKYHK